MENMMELDIGHGEKYKMEEIQDSEVYARESKGHLPSDFYYLVLWKVYLDEKNT